MALAYIPNYSQTPLGLLLEQYKNQPIFSALASIVAGEMQSVEDALWNTLTIAVGPSIESDPYAVVLGGCGLRPARAVDWDPGSRWRPELPLLLERARSPLGNGALQGRALPP